MKQSLECGDWQGLWQLYPGLTSRELNLLVYKPVLFTVLLNTHEFPKLTTLEDTPSVSKQQPDQFI